MIFFIVVLVSGGARINVRNSDSQPEPTMTGIQTEVLLVVSPVFYL